MAACHEKLPSQTLSTFTDICKTLYMQRGLNTLLKQTILNIAANRGQQAQSLLKLHSLTTLILETSKSDFTPQDLAKASPLFKLCYHNSHLTPDLFFDKIKYLDRVYLHNRSNSGQHNHSAHASPIPDVDFIYSGPEKPSPNKFMPITGVTNNKPIGGLWTSPIIENIDRSEWQDFCLAEELSVSKYQEKWHIVPSTDCRMLVVDAKMSNLKPYMQNTITEEDLDDSSLSIQHSQREKYINFQKLAEDYDAIYISRDVQIDNYISGYDVSTCIFMHPKFMVFDNEEYQQYKAQNNSQNNKLNNLKSR